MLRVSNDITNLFESQLALNNIPANQWTYFHKWLRYYLDFCAKYNLQPNDTRHYVVFNDKLRSKGQTDEQCRQARRAMAIYYRSVGVIQPSAPNKPVQRDAGDQVNGMPKEARQVLTARAITSTPASIPIAGKSGELANGGLQSTGASWVDVHARLEAAIKVRHYSVKTWQAYRHWLTAFQAFTKSKDPRLLAMDDVKGFLSFLAVEKHVAASSQNQAFNALLFLFKIYSKKSSER